MLIGISNALRTPNYLQDKFNTNIEVQTTSIPLQAQFIRGNSNLKPERIISKEFGNLGDFGKLNLDAKVFMTIFMILLNRILIKQPRVYANAGDVAVKGFEAQAKWHIAKDTHFLLNYAYVNIDVDEKQTANNITVSMPRNTISALLTRRFNSQWDEVMPIIIPIKLPLWEMLV